jgi:glyoxylate reductase
MTAMSKRTVLLIGELTHTNKEWKEYSSKYTLKVCIEGVCCSDTGADRTSGIPKWQQERLPAETTKQRIRRCCGTLPVQQLHISTSPIEALEERPLRRCVQETGPFDKELIALLPKSLKYICHNGAGYDNVDVDTLTQKGSSPDTDTFSMVR